MSQEILTGNLLSDGIVYHASDINAALNNATIQPGVIENKAIQSASQQDKVLLSRDGSLTATTIQSIMAITRTNMQTFGNCNISQGVAFSGQLVLTQNGTLNDWNPPNFSLVTIVALAGTATITGMAAPPANGTLKVIYANGGTITFNNNDTGSAIANRLFWKVAPTITIVSFELAVFLYFGARWRLLCHTHGI